MANNTNYKIEATTDTQGNPCIKVSWQGSGNATKVKVGIQNLNNFSGYGYGISWGSTNACTDGGWGSGSVGVSQTNFSGMPGLTLPVFIRPCYLSAVTS